MAQNLRKPAYHRGHFQIHGTKYFVRIKERILKEEIVEPPPAKAAKIGRSKKRFEPDYSSLFRPKKFSFRRSDKLHLSICTVGLNDDVQKTEDTPTMSIENKLPESYALSSSTLAEKRVTKGGYRFAALLKAIRP